MLILYITIDFSIEKVWSQALHWYTDHAQVLITNIWCSGDEQMLKRETVLYSDGLLLVKCACVACLQVALALQ